MAGADLHKPPFTEVAVLTDGGVYDNLGLERVWKRCRTILVSNAGRNTPEIGSPSGRWTGANLPDAVSGAAAGGEFQEADSVRHEQSRPEKSGTLEH